MTEPCDDGVIWVYVTARDNGEALLLAETLVGEGIAACANVLGPATSVYRWEGEVRRDTETPLVVKTRRSLLAQVVARVRELHSYEVPCVVALEAVGGNPDFMDWVRSQTLRRP
jgi:periplasmic divalent cation tolerance protein